MDSQRKTSALAAVLLLLPAGLCWSAAPRPAARKVSAPSVQSKECDSPVDPLPGGALARLGPTRFCLQGYVDRVSFSPDGRVLASTPFPGTVTALVLWDARTGRLLHKLGNPLQEGGAPFDHYSFLPDGKAILSADSPGQHLVLWDVATGREIRRWQGPGTELTGLAVSRQGLAAYADSQGVVRLWNVNRPEPPRPIAWDDALALGYSVALTDDGTRLVAVGDWWEVRVLELASGRVVHHFRLGRPQAALLAADGRTVITTSAEQELRFWDVATGKQHCLRKSEQAACAPLAFSPEGSTAASLGKDGRTLHLWDFATGRDRLVPLQRTTQPIGELLALSAGARIVATGDGRRHRFLLWDAKTGQPLLDEPGHDLPPEHLAFSPDGQRLISVAADDRIGCWDIPRSRLLRLTHLLDKVVGRTNPLWCLSPDGRWLALNNLETVQLYETRSHQLIRQINWPRGWMEAMAFSPDRNRLAVAVSDGVLHVWEIPSGRHVRAIDTTKEGPAISWVGFLPDGRTLASGNGPLRAMFIGNGPSDQPLAIHLWDIASGRHRGRMPADPQRWKEAAFDVNWHCCFTPDGKNLFGANRDSLMIWDMLNRREAESFEPDLDRTCQRQQSEPVKPSLAVSPDSRLLARLGADASLSLWEIASGQKVYEFAGNHSAVQFAPDGRTLATACLDDSTLLVWDLPTLLRDGAAGAPVRRPWQELASAEARRAYQAVGWLTADPQAVPLLADHLVPATRPDTSRVPLLLQDLDSDDFATRQQATRCLQRLGVAVHPTLQEIDKTSTSAEVRRRARWLLRQLDPKAPQHLREVRAVQVLEYLGTPPARQLLEKLARGVPHARLTQEAKASLERLARRPAAP